MTNTKYNLNDLLEIVARLRIDCPWDRDQTHESIAPMLIEEAYEVKEAVQNGDDDELKKELGDILLHSVMHSAIAGERGAFQFNDVIQSLCEKLITRHPHVFGDAVANDAEAVKKNWEQIKMTEGRKSLFDGMPKAMPALQRADRVQEKASKVGFDWERPEDVYKKVEEELAELHEVITSGEDIARRTDEFGDVMFALVNYARFIGVVPEEALHGTINKFIKRFKHIEMRVAEKGLTLADVGLEEMDGYWNEAKGRSREPGAGSQEERA